MSGIDPTSLITDGSTFGIVAAALYGAYKLYRGVKSDERETRETTDLRLDRLRRNQLAMTKYAGELARLVPPDVELPGHPALESELKPREE